MKIFGFLILTFVFGLSFFDFFSVAYAGPSSTSFELENPINFIEGGPSESSSFQYISTTGQLTQGESESTTFLQQAGFLYFPVIITPGGGGGDDGGGGGGGRGYNVPGLNLNCRIADFNCDARVNIFDLSILLYYLDVPIPVVDPYDLSKDNKVDFIDTSIVFYYWDKPF